MMMIGTLFPYVVTSVCVLIALWSARRNASPPRCPGPTGHWLLGNLDFLTKGKLYENFIDGVSRYGPLFKLRILHQTLYILSDPEAISRLLKGAPHAAAKPGAIYDCFNRMTYPKSLSIISSQDDDKYFKVVRAASAKVFSMQSLRAMFPGIRATACEAFHNSFVQPQASGRPVAIEMDALFLRITVDVLGHLMHGQGWGACSGGPCPMLEMVERQCQVAANYTINSFRPYFFWDKEAMREVQYNRQYNAALKDFIVQMRTNPPPPHTLGAHLLSLKDPHTGGPFPELRLRAELALFMMAGFETTGHSAALALFSIIAHPEVEERVTAELDTLGLLATPACPTPRQLQWEDLSKLRVLSAAVQESLRWLPAATMGFVRVLAQQTEVCGRMLPKGSILWVPCIAVHRSPHNWERPHDYDINRWLGSASNGDSNGGTVGDDGGSDSSGKAPKGYLPFSEGPRSCVGQALARVEVLVVLAQLLGSFRVELAPGMGGKEGVLKSLDVLMAMRPKDGLWCHVQPRVAA